MGGLVIKIFEILLIGLLLSYLMILLFCNFVIDCLLYLPNIFIKILSLSNMWPRFVVTTTTAH